jgi:HAD superfamily hydrolase (TIGR01490 family)
MQKKQAINSNVIAAFDFDHTLINRDSLLPFLFFNYSWTSTLGYLLQLLPDFISYAFRKKSRQQIKEAILTKFFKGEKLDDLKEKANSYAAQCIDNFLASDALERLNWHKQQGHRCVIISASIDIYLIPWAKTHGIDRVISSQLEKSDDGSITGKLQGANCWGQEKVRRLLKEFGSKEKFILYAYGDSRGDLELLQLADFPFYRTFN